MLLQNFRGDGKAKTSATLLGGKVWKEETLAHVVGEARARVRDGELDHAGTEQARRNAQLTKQALLHGFGGVVDEVGERALEGFGVSHDQRKIGCERAHDADAAEAA